MRLVENLEEFNSTILSKKTCVIFCSLTFCQPCKLLNSFFEELIEKHKDDNDLEFFKIYFDNLDSHDEDDIKDRLNIQGKKYPIFILFKDNNVLCECDYNSHKDLPNMIEFLI